MAMAKSKELLIGREAETRLLEKALSGGRNILIEGPVGVGKTYLVQTILAEGKRPFYRVDGDTRYSEQKLTGWFDPPLVLKPGQGLRYETTHTYDDPPSDNAPPLTFAETSEDEMAILLGFYAIN